MRQSNIELFELAPAVLKWARERVQLKTGELAKKIGVKEEKVLEWERTGAILTHHLLRLAKHTRTDTAYLWANALSDVALPIADFRAKRSVTRKHPSPELHDTLVTLEGRQSWIQELLKESGAKPLAFPASHDYRKSSPDTVADAMRSALDLDPDWSKPLDQAKARRHLFDSMDRAGILVSINGVVGNNARRPLDPDEFRGFALCDDYAPLIFANGKDARSAQIFTLAHELAHVIIGKSGLSLWDLQAPSHGVERFCNAAAAEFLVPHQSLLQLQLRRLDAEEQISLVARRFCVSKMVAAYRLTDIGLLSAGALRKQIRQYDVWLTGDEGRKPRSSGGNFMRTQHYRLGVRAGDTLAKAVSSGRIKDYNAWKIIDLYGDKFDAYVNYARGRI